MTLGANESRSNRPTDVAQLQRSRHELYTDGPCTDDPTQLVKNDNVSCVLDHRTDRIVERNRLTVQTQETAFNFRAEDLKPFIETNRV